MIMALVRWRSILANWINCYDEGTDWQLQRSTLDRILEKLQPESDSKVEEFIFDKYPECKFENGTLQLSTEEGVVMAASLLLLHMCVHSKDVEMKNVMCRKLSREDQEVILKFTKCLMNRTPVTCDDVRAAILECMGADLLWTDTAANTSTPPPLRALHGEVRRLKAALDAERFDRTYLQDELANTNSKVEKLLNDKEQYKQEISSLKAQLLTQESEHNTSSQHTPKGNTARRKLARQLSAMEERLVDTRELLEEAERARDVYKAKLEETKGDRDKWVSFGQRESERACLLADELDMEKKTCSSLREMLSELRDHHKMNSGDDSLVECDDDSPRRRSFVHDSSLCGDVCASVIDVQLCEERARISSLTQELKAYQDKVNTLEKILRKKEDEIQIKCNEIETELKRNDEMKTTFNKQQSKMQQMIDENIAVIRNFTSLIEDLKTENESLEKKSMEYEKEVQNNKCHINDIESENRKIHFKAEEAKKLMTGIIEELKADKKYLENKVANIQLIVTSNQAHIKELVDENAKYKESTQSMSVLIQKLKTENCCLQKKISELNNINKANESQIEELHRENVQMTFSSQEAIKSMALKFDQTESQKEELTQKINEHVTTIAANELLITEMQRDNVQLMETIQQKNCDIKSIKQEKENIQTNANILGKIISTIESQISTLINENIDIAKEATESFELMNLKLDTTTEGLEEKIFIFGEMVKLYKFKITQMQEENNLLKAKAIESSKQLTAMIYELTKQKDDLEAQIYEYDNICKSTQTEIVKLQQENAQFLNENILLEAKAVETSQSHNSIIEEFTREKEILEAKIQECENISTFTQNEIQALTLQNTQLKNENEKVEAKAIEICQSHNALINQLNVVREALNTQIQEYENISVSSAVEIAKLSQGNAQLQNENAHLTAKALETLETHKSAIEEFNKEIYMTGIKIQQYENISATARKEIEVLQVQITQFKIEKLNLMDWINGFSNNMAKEFMLFENKLDKKLCEYENLCVSYKKGIANLEQEAAQSRNENVQLKAIILETSESHKAVDHKNNKEKEELKNKSEEISKMSEANVMKIKKLEEECYQIKQNSEQSIKTLSHEIDKLKQEKFQLDQKVKNYQNSLSANETQICETKNEVVKLKAIYDETLKKMNDELSELNKEKELIENKVIDYENMIINDQTQISEMQLENEKNTNAMATVIQHLTEEKENLEKRVLELRNTITTAESIIEEQKKENKKIFEKTNENTTLISRINQLKTKNDLLKNNVVDLENTIKSNKTQMNDIKNRNATLVEHVEDSAKFIDECMKEVARLEKKLIIIAENMGNYKSEMKHIKTEVEETNNEFSNKDQMLWNKAQIAELTRRMETVMQYIVDNFENLEAENSLLQHKLKENCSNFENYKTEVNCCLNELDAIKIKSLEIEKEKETLNMQNKKLQSQMEKLQSDNEILEIKIEEITTEMSSEVTELRTAKTSLEHEIQEYNNMVKQLKEDCEQVKEKFKKSEELMTVKINEIQAQNETLEKDVIHYINTIACNKSEIEQLEKEKTIYKEKSENIGNSAAVEMSELKMGQKCLERKIADYESSIESILLEKKNLQEEKVQQKSKIDDISKLYAESIKENKQLIEKHEKSLNAVNNILELNKCKSNEIEKKIFQQYEDNSRLLKENEELVFNLEKCKAGLSSTYQNIKNLLSLQHSMDEIPVIDLSNKNSEEIQSALNEYVNSLINLCKVNKHNKSTMEQCITKLKCQIRDITEELYTVKLKLKIIISQNNGYLDTMTKDTDLFEKKYGFVNVTQDMCVVPDANDSLEQFVAAVENILLRNKTIANVFKTEFKSLCEIHKQTLAEKENVSANITLIKADYEKRLNSINEQLSDKKALVSHLEKDIQVMENDKNLIIKNLNDTLEKKKLDEQKLWEENNLKIEELNTKLEDSYKARDGSILTMTEEYKIKENMKIKQCIEKIEALQKEVFEKTKAIEQKLEIERQISAFRVDIKDKLNEFNLTLVELRLADDYLNGTQEQLGKPITPEVRQLCDEEKIKMISSEEVELVKIKEDLQKLIENSTTAVIVIKDTTTKLKLEVDKNSQLETALLAKNTLLESLQHKLENTELKLDNINAEYKNTKAQNLALSDLLMSKESQLNAAEAKLFNTETVIAEKEEIIHKLNNNLEKVATERDSLKEKLNTNIETIRETITNISMLMDIFESKDTNKVDDVILNIGKLFSIFYDNESKLTKPLHLRFKNLSNVIADLKDRNNVLNEKCEQMELEKNSKIKMLANEVAALSESIAHREDLVKNVRVTKEKDVAELQMQVELLSSDLIGTSEERNQTISNLEKIVYDRNRTITTLQGDITYLKSLVAESQYKLLDVTKELEQCRENCSQLSSQLKRTVSQKNEEITSLKKQLSKISSYENDASRIIKVSAKYQAIILKRIAEIKSNPVLRELTQFSNIESDKRKSVGGAVTIDELENFLEGTEKHLRKLAEKQSILQKERDTLAEVSKINESETISLKKYLTELLAHFKTFSSVKDMYNQKLTQVISKQRMIRREIHSLENIPDNVMAKIERSYGIVMQDLCETTLNLSRWAERCIDRSISPEKLKQAFASDAPTLSTSHFQNTGLEVQIDELMTAFKKVYEEVQKAKTCEPSRPTESCNVMEVRAEYEDKLNRMKAKMKQLYHQQMSAYQNNQDAELDKMKSKMEEKSKAYEEHIQGLTRELWSVGEKFLMKKEEAEWLRRRPSSSSLMSLQHVHSSGLGPPPREGRESRVRDDRPCDTQSLHGVPAHKPKTEGRGFHMSDEEGEVFDNRWLKELETPPPPVRERRRSTAVGAAGGTGRISELKYRNSLCLPHLKSSYPAETHFAAGPCNEDEIKFEQGAAVVERRKEVGIIAYKKPGPPTPSKNAGRLSATDSELRESLRSEPDAPSLRKLGTPSRLKALFRSNRSDAENSSTPRSKRLSIFRKK